ncbi:MAG: molybdopterin-dependent oxidoreductase [Chloroflexota bacterium]
MSRTTHTNIIPTSDCHDCGGRCVLNMHIEAGRIKRIETDSSRLPQYRACAKGRAYRQMVYAPERLKYPMKRAGKRGSGQFTRISWDEALDTLAGEIKRVRERYGPASVLFLQGSGSLGAINGGGEPVRHVLVKSGGCTTRWGSPSAEGSRFASRATYGTLATAHSRDDILNSRLILMWGWNPAVSLHGVNTKVYLARAKEAGARIISIDPRYNDTAALLADKWLPIRPSTDAAALIAMAHTIITRGLADQHFIHLHTSGYEAWRAYILGEEDSLPKTPEWAETITGLKSRDIIETAVEYATLKPAALMTGYAPGRTAYGEQFHRAAAALAAITGNLGIPGGNPAGHGLLQGARLPAPTNPVEPSATAVDDSFDLTFRSRYRVHGADLWRAITEGKKGGHPADFKLVYVASSNPLNQMLNANNGIKSLEKPEFIVVQDTYLSTTARFADLILPASGHVEHVDTYRPSYPERYFIFINKAVAPPGECLSDTDIARALAKRLGTDYQGGKTDEALLEEYLSLSGLTKDAIEKNGARRIGILKQEPDQPMIAFAGIIRHPEKERFPTPSGRIELYSSAIAGLKNPEIPPVPKYLEPAEGPANVSGPYPIRLISTHFWRRANSCFDRAPWLKEIEPQAIMISTADAEKRGIRNGDLVRAFNSRGQMLIRARVTERIMPGVADISEGAWLELDENGVDRGGCPNVLTLDRPSPAGAYPYNTCLIEIEKARE